MFPRHRRRLGCGDPLRDPTDAVWAVPVTVAGDSATVLGWVRFDDDAHLVDAPDPQTVLDMLETLTDDDDASGVGFDDAAEPARGDGWELHCRDGIEVVAAMPDRSVGLLLTDPPYGISRRLTCESQVPRRLRRDGSDFVMPRGHFGDWDSAAEPHAWTAEVLPKVSGWAVTFCAHAQIGVYCDIFAGHGLVAVGPMVWHKTNPVPFNARHKPLSAWEAIVVGKRPGTPFNGRMVHNVFTHKSPSPQQRIHPTQKPVPLLAEFVDLFSQPDDLVADPFAGSASTLVAAGSRGRRSVGCEQDPAMFAAAVSRLRDSHRMHDAG